MSQAEVRLVKVYACKKRVETFLYLDAEQEVESLDADLQRTLGALRFVMDLELHAQRALASADPVRVLAAIEEKGYYLQVPPPVPKVELRP